MSIGWRYLRRMKRKKAARYDKDYNADFDIDDALDSLKESYPSLKKSSVPIDIVNTLNKSSKKR